ncbi:MAG: GNAT family N-acetyltransferase [Dermatophilaceae bacterium]
MRTPDLTRPGQPDPTPAGPVVAEPEADRRLAELAAWSDDPSAILAVNEGTDAFRSPGIPGFIAYRRSGRWLVQVGGAYAPEPSRATLIEHFRGFAHENRCRVLAVQLQERDARSHAAAGYTVNQVGASYALPVAEFTLRGKPFVSLRNKISRAQRAGVDVELTTASALSGPDRAAFDALDAQWLRAKGRFARPLHTLVGELAGPGGAMRRLVVARLGGEPVGYVSLSPVFGSRPGWLHDLSRRRADAPPGVMELLVSRCIQQCADEGTPWWHFGFTPFTSLDPAVEIPGASPVVARLVALLAHRGARVYPAASQLDYKRKWGALHTLPDYLAFDGRPSAAGVFRLLKVTNLI